VYGRNWGETGRIRASLDGLRIAQVSEPICLALR
jgi:hypothetical protein